MHKRATFTQTKNLFKYNAVIGHDGACPINYFEQTILHYKNRFTRLSSDSLRLGNLDFPGQGIGSALPRPTLELRGGA